MLKPGYRNVLITGGLGFIGGVTAEMALQAGSSVTIVDSLVSNVYSPGHFRFRYPRAQVVEDATIDFLRRNPASNFDLVIHAASPVGPAGLLARSGSIASEIVETTDCVAHWCVAHGAPLVYISSAEVYGVSGTLSESMDSHVPPAHNSRTEYALAKLTSECLVANCRHHGLKAVAIRPFNVVGARQSRAGGFVMPTFVQQALGGKPLTVFESGMQQRAFISVIDLAQFLLRWAPLAIDQNVPVVNVGNPHNGTTILQLARHIIRLTGSASAIRFTHGTDVYGPLYSEARSERKLPDVALAGGLGWRPAYALDEIIRTIVEFYGAHMDVRGSDARLIVA